MDVALGFPMRIGFIERFESKVNWNPGKVGDLVQFFFRLDKRPNVGDMLAVGDGLLAICGSETVIPVGILIRCAGTVKKLFVLSLAGQSGL